ncbi:MerR family transcriptional regulator [Streptomyces monomycini]|uniref:MerR family transcriptional regulator n=1 Tax=Streptomyces monomycini TaxID=371720 RepID=UPI000998C166
MQIGEPAQCTGASRRSIRHYEQQGLLEAQHTDRGRRSHDEHAVHRVLNVRDCSEPGCGWRASVRWRPAWT